MKAMLLKEQTYRSNNSTGYWIMGESSMDSSGCESLGIDVMMMSISICDPVAVRRLAVCDTVRDAIGNWESHFWNVEMLDDGSCELLGGEKGP